MLNQRVEDLCFETIRRTGFQGTGTMKPPLPHTHLPLSTNFCFSPSTYWHHLNTTVKHCSLGANFLLMLCIDRKLSAVSNGYIFQAGLENIVGPKIEACRLKHVAKRIIPRQQSDHSHSLLQTVQCSAMPWARRSKSVSWCLRPFFFGPCLLLLSDLLVPQPSVF